MDHGLRLDARTSQAATTAALHPREGLRLPVSLLIERDAQPAGVTVVVSQPLASSDQATPAGDTRTSVEARRPQRRAAAFWRAR